MRCDAITPDALLRRLGGALPGAEAHCTMKPRRRPGEFHRVPENLSRRSAVLILVVPGEEGNPPGPAVIPLIERTDDGGPHAGQIALPGGSMEHTDGSIVETALREAREEIGVASSACRVLGTLTPLHIDVSGFVVTPVVAWYDGPHPGDDPGDDPLFSPFTPDPREVRRIIPVDPSMLARTRTVAEVVARGYRFPAPVYRAGNTVIWGATAMILAEFISLWDGRGYDNP